MVELEVVTFRVTERKIDRNGCEIQKNINTDVKEAIFEVTDKQQQYDLERESQKDYSSLQYFIQKSCLSNSFLVTPHAINKIMNANNGKTKEFKIWYEDRKSGPLRED